MTSSLPQVQEQQGRPIGRRPVSVRKGSGGRELGGQGARVAGAPRVEMQAGQSGGGDTYLSCDPARRRSQNIPNLGLEVCCIKEWTPARNSRIPHRTRVQKACLIGTLPG